MTAFLDFPDAGNGYRLVGDPAHGQVAILTEEQFRVEQWRDCGNGDWRPSMAGIQRMNQLRRQRWAEDRQARSTLGPDLDMTEYLDAIEDGRPSGYVSRRPGA